MENMASIGGLSSSTSSSLGSLKGYGGLVSGLDRDSLIEAMTSGTQSKIQKQKQKKQKITWQQEAIRNITDKMYEFSQKYMSYTSSSNLTSSSFFAKSQITSVGANAKYVSVTGNSSLIDQISVAGVKQLASKAQVSSSDMVSDQIITTGKDIDINGNVTISSLAGESFSIKVGSDTYSITLPKDAKYDYLASENSDGKTTLEKTLDVLNQKLKDTKLSSGEGTLADVISFSATKVGNGESEKDAIVITNNSTGGNDIELLSGDSFFRKIGILGENEKLSSLTKEQKTIPAKKTDTDGTSKPGTLVSSHDISLTESKKVVDMLKETSLSFSYNGEVKWIKIDEKTNITSLEDYQKALQTQLDKEFGKDRIKVGMDGSKLTFQTMNPSSKTVDKSSTLSITASTTYGVLGENGVLGIKEGASNRINLTDKAGDVFNNLFNPIMPLDEESTEQTPRVEKIKINDVDIEISENDTVQDVMDKINKSDAGVKMEYLSNLDKFVITSTEEGASGEIKFDSSTNSVRFLKDLGITKDEKGTDIATQGAKDITLSTGKDAIISIKYKDSNETIEISRGSNSFKLDKLTISVTGTFGEYGEDGKLVEGSTEAVTFDAKANTDKVTTAVKEMIEGFNSIIEMVNKQVSTKQSATEKYEPLTDQQREEMTEDQIKQWEEKAKVGILYNDSDLRSLMNSLRFILPTGTDRQELSDIGITVSSSYSDNGKLTFDEEKFKAAMASDPSKVEKLFTQTQVTDENGTVTTQNGVMTNMKRVMDKYASMTGSTKGILVERAGSTKAPTTILKNGLQTQLDQIASIIEKLQTTLTNEQNRYINQFTQLETAISKMNAQSSWLSQS